MTDELTLAYLNLFAILGALKPLCEMEPQAAALIADRKVSVGIAVKGGPTATLHFDHGTVRVSEGIERCDIKLPFSSPKKFNGLIDGTVTPIPSKGFTKIGFLLGPFTKLTDMLSAYLRPKAEDLKDENFFSVSTKLMLHVIANAVAQIGNQEKIGQASASYMVDGVVHLSVKDEAAVAIEVKSHHLTVLSEVPDIRDAMSYMEFADLHIARELFDGQRNAVASVGEGLIRIGGMISQVDNVNRILDRVALYLA